MKPDGTKGEILFCWFSPFRPETSAKEDCIDAGSKPTLHRNETNHILQCDNDTSRDLGSQGFSRSRFSGTTNGHRGRVRLGRLNHRTLNGSCNGNERISSCFEKGDSIGCRFVRRVGGVDFDSMNRRSDLQSFVSLLNSKPLTEESYVKSPVPSISNSGGLSVASIIPCPNTQLKPSFTRDGTFHVPKSLRVIMLWR